MDGLGALDAELTTIAALLAGADEAALRRPVRACPGWDVAEVVRHLGGVHRWATAIVVTGRDGSVDADEVAARAPAARRPADLLAWSAAGAASLRAALGTAPADRPCETLVGPGTASFWLRRQVLEAAVHRFDIADVLGPTAPMDPGTAADGIDEVLSVLAPRQVRLGRTPPLPGRLTVTATDAARTWQIGCGPSAASLSGPAEPVLLALWGRLDRGEGDWHAAGDLDLVAAALRAGALTP